MKRRRSTAARVALLGTIAAAVVAVGGQHGRRCRWGRAPGLLRHRGDLVVRFPLQPARTIPPTSSRNRLAWPRAGSRNGGWPGRTAPVCQAARGLNAAWHDERPTEEGSDQFQRVFWSNIQTLDKAGYLRHATEGGGAAGGPDLDADGWRAASRILQRRSRPTSVNRLAMRSRTIACRLSGGRARHIIRRGMNREPHFERCLAGQVEDRRGRRKMACWGQGIWLRDSPDIEQRLNSRWMRQHRRAGR